MAETQTKTSRLCPPTIDAPPAPLGLFSFALRFVRNPLRAVPRTVYERDFVATQVGPIKYVWITEPELIEQVLIKQAQSFEKTPLERRVLERALGDGMLTSEEDMWRWQRRTIAPLFRHSEVLSHVDKMADAGQEKIENWRLNKDQTVHRIDRDMTEVTFSVIARTMLGEDQGELSSTIRDASETYLSNATWEMAHAILRLPRWLPHPGTGRLRRSASQMRNAVQTIIDQRRSAPPNRDEKNLDLLDRLLAARNPETDALMSDRQLINNLLTLLDAGHETTAKALTWTLYLLARAPQWQNEVRREVKDVVGQGAIKEHHIDELAITQRVIKESIRLYPPAPIVARTPRENVEIAGQTFLPGAQIAIPIYCVHRHRARWHDPDRFDPDRFLPEHESKIPRTQYMPFGAGPRICIGQAFAMIEATVLLATFIRAAEFSWIGNHKPEPISRVTLTPKGGMPLGLRSIA